MHFSYIHSLYFKLELELAHFIIHFSAQRMDVPTGVLQCTPSTDKKLFDATVSESAAQCGDKLKSRLAVQMETAVRDEENLAVVPVSHGRREETLFSSTAGEWLHSIKISKNLRLHDMNLPYPPPPPPLMQLKTVA